MYYCYAAYRFRYFHLKNSIFLFYWSQSLLPDKLKKKKKGKDENENLPVVVTGLIRDQIHIERDPYSFGFTDCGGTSGR